MEGLGLSHQVVCGYGPSANYHRDRRHEEFRKMLS